MGTEDNFTGISFVEYFKVCRDKRVLAIPHLFKNMMPNIVFFKNMNINLEHATALKQLLIDTAQIEDVTPENNPFIIKTLVIDDCGMADEAFEQVLLGINA